MGERYCISVPPCLIVGGGTAFLQQNIWGNGVPPRSPSTTPLLTATLTKRLNAAHHRWLRGILGISWKDKVTNEEVRTRTEQQSMDNILRERRFRWLGHVIRMDYGRSAHTSAGVALGGSGLQERSRPSANKLEERVVNKELLKVGLTWEEAEVTALNRSE